MITMSKIEDLKNGMARQRELALKNFAAQIRNSKYPLVMAYQKGEITAEEYEDVVGEPYSETMRDNYQSELDVMRERMIQRVQDGHLTEQQYKAITGEEYPAAKLAEKPEGAEDGPEGAETPAEDTP